MGCFEHFGLDMCFAPKRHALFRHLNLQKWSENGVFCTFSLWNVLRATTACNFSLLIWPAGSAPAALASLLFDPRSPKSLEKHSVSRHSYLFSHLHLLSSYSFSSTLLSSHLSLLSASSLLCISSVHIVGSLTSKLPSIIVQFMYDFSPLKPPCIDDFPAGHVWLPEAAWDLRWTMGWVVTLRIGYRILEKTGSWVRPNEDHTPRQGIMRDIYDIASILQGLQFLSSF